MDALVDGVDHVYIPMADAAGAFHALSELLGLPVMWPFGSFGDFSSGGVSLGSIKLEILEANPTTPWSAAQDPPRVQAIAFAPSRHVDESYLAELGRRSIGHLPPAHYDRNGRPGWTNVYFSDFISDAAGVFVCDYLTPEPRDLQRRRRVLAECNGGRLGVLDAVALVISTRSLEAARDRWQRLLDPVRPREPDRWQPAVGPTIVLTEGEEERVEHLVVAARSPERATRLLREIQVEGARDLPLRFVPGV
jgi:hypothetical protein